MSQLNDPVFIDFDGTPIPGRVPPKLTVHGGPLSQGQYGAVAHAFRRFKDSVRGSKAEYLVQNKVLKDGTKVRMVSIQDHDYVHVWPVGGGGKVKLPHGFAVVTNWRSPRIYKRRLAWPPEETQWEVAADHVQQVNNDNYIYDNQVFRKPAGKPFFNLPMVFQRVKRTLWDYARRAGLYLVSSNLGVAFRLKDSTTGKFSLFPAHYAVDNKVLKSDGTVLYTMTDAPIILAPTAMEYPEPVHYLPSQTDAQGNQIALNQVRYAVLSPTANIWKFRFANERLQRISDTEYEALERNVQDIITPWSSQTVGVTNVNDGSLGENPDDLLYAVGMGLRAVDGVGAVGGSGWLSDLGITASWVTGWWDPPLDISGVIRRNSYLLAMRQIVTQTAGSATLSKLLAAGVHNVVSYIDILSELNYPADIFWRGGEAGIGYWTSDIFGTSFSGDGYGTSNAIIKRKDTKYNVDGTPKVTAKLGWKDLMLFEGTTTGRMSGRVYENVETIYGKFQNYMGRTFIVQETYQSTNPAGAGYVSPSALGTWLAARNIRNTYYEDLRLAHGVLPFSGPNPTTKSTTLYNERPTNSVSYSLTSRYVIDYDHKGRFYAAIRCEVVCSGAAWNEDATVYEGHMKEDSAPTYTVKIWFECNWNNQSPPAGTVNELLLVEETVTRPGFEIIAIQKWSPWYWPFPAYSDRNCTVRVPPEPKPDEDFMMMFKNLASHQGVNTNLCCADVRPDITGDDKVAAESVEGIEYSTVEGGSVVPHTRYVTGQLYARTFKLSDLYEAFWLLRALKCDAVQDNFTPEWDPDRPTWYYHPLIKAALNVDRHIEVRDGGIVQWSDNIKAPATGYPPTVPPSPPPADRDIKLYRI